MDIQNQRGSLFSQIYLSDAGSDDSAINTDKTYSEIMCRQLQSCNERTSRINLDKNNAKYVALGKKKKLITPMEASMLRDAGFIFPDFMHSLDSPEQVIPPGKYLVQRSVSLWKGYGNPNQYNYLFHKGVQIAVNGITHLDWGATQLVNFAEAWRNIIEVKRHDKNAKDFGLRRNSESIPYFHYYCTGFNRKHGRYGYALSAAIKLKESDNYISSKSLQLTDKPVWMENLGYYCPALFAALKSYVVLGRIGDQVIPLTWYAFMNRDNINDDFENYVYELFGSDPDCYDPVTRESGIWFHPDHPLIEKVEPYIKLLIQRALAGDLTAIPRIHWWYVHLAPVLRGSGGVAELIVRCLCMKHGFDLPRWRDGIAPSVEVLLEPDENKFCSEYHLLFEDNLHGRELKGAFSVPRHDRSNVENR